MNISPAALDVLFDDAIAAALIFLGRLTPPDIASHYFIQGLGYLAISIPAYLAGSRHWLGKW